nr:envelope protein {V1 region, clone 2-C7} [simian immunodeficiency virus SIV, DeltaB670rh, Peptide Partial Mutant, 44 aa] [Simian immunodeficiency virus]
WGLTGNVPTTTVPTATPSKETANVVNETSSCVKNNNCTGLEPEP